ncbi:mannose-1-phosphate guanylyltransferase/mannose-6-phosphate isomerase [Acidihalobacter prosperus]|uniref:mannose-1-phosphate guanylyltransferase n=1 Tax=Acidihalobacter prosperus TaxID=160660 RepID=A0A1A6C5Y0_9GAMM|nr:mannose-1-phosphate guanylyltransferase/mannose-6-phosphate isomerase [Acidihalobacter prosperus]OBS09969.1 mannose-1-phosphate guanylyltransferase/mannose-6-phosphate isomerase [Acidihalobacter prosperus]
MTQIVPVILSGGSGTRLWPLSRHAYPKQFIPLVGELSLFQTTLRRLAGLPGVAAPCVVGNDEQRFMVAEQLRALGVDGRILLEPIGRNTAPAIAAAALDIAVADPQALMLVLPADHLINDVQAFHAAVAAATAAARDGALVTFGVVPTRAETGYGYIEAGDVLGEGPARRVARFVEKPALDVAEAYVAGGRHWWNSGMFLFTAERYLQVLETHAPAILEAARRAHALAREDLDFLRLDAEAFAASPSDSIDYAVMEPTDDAVVVPLDAGWSDVGSWQALWEVGAKDETGNRLEGDVIALDCRDSYVHAEHRLVAVLGLSDVVVAETADAVLVSARDRVQEVKSVVGRLKGAGREESVNHRRVLRPWGAYEGISLGERFQVKRITVKPGERLSLQMHHHRAEHWIVVRGTARVTRGDEVFTLAENESTFIPLGVTHRLENPGRIELEMIEVQSGSYLGEDDIVRFEDSYGRG